MKELLINLEVDLMVKQKIDIEILHRGKIFTHVGTDPYARDATYNFNHCPSVMLMPDNRLFIVWFSGPWEGHHLQCLLASYSADDGVT